MFDCTCNTQKLFVLNQHNGDDAPQNRKWRMTGKMRGNNIEQTKRKEENEVNILKEIDGGLRRKWKRIKKKENLEEEETENR